MKELNLPFGITIGGTHKTLIIADIGLCHDGDVGVAKELMCQCKKAGADVVKFQKRDVDNLAIASVLDAPDERFPHFGSTYREIRQHVEFDLPTYKLLYDYAKELNIPFLVSVFDEKSADEMLELGLPWVKVASHVLSRKPLIEKLCQLKLPVLASTGMAYLEEIDEAADMFNKSSTPFALFHCVSTYPHKAEQANLSMLPFLAKRYNVPVGYSCHELEDTSSLLAVAAGATMLERHVTLDRARVGFDHRFALTMECLAVLVKEIRRVESILGNAQKSVAEEEWEARRKFHSSVVSAVPLAKGTCIQRSMLTVKSPGTGIPAREIDSIVGRVTVVDIPSDVLLSPDMLEQK